VALRKLRWLNRSREPADLRVPPGNRWKHYEATESASTAFGSLTNGGFASYGPPEDREMSRSSTTTAQLMAKGPLLHNPHPGEILAEESMKPMGITQNALARAIGVPPRRINEIVLGKRAVSADTDLRLARYFGLSEGFFLGLQIDFELMEKRRQIEAELRNIGPRAA
jgi:addiction module HigA family antidote